MPDPIPFRPPMQEEQPPLPCNIELEQALLGAVLMNNAALDRVGDFLKPEHFFEPLHQKVFDVCATLIRAGKVVNPLTIKTYLPADLDVAGLPLNQYIARLAAEATSVANAQDYGRSLYDLSVRRSLALLAEDIREQALRADLDVPPLKQIEEIEQKLFDLSDRGGDDTADQTMMVEHAVTEAVDRIAQAYQNDGKLIGITWGVPSVDALTHGLHPGELTILAGRPSMGKSALALSAGRAAAQSGQGVALFSLEMSSESLGMRLLSEAVSMHGPAMPYFRMRSGQIEHQDFDRIIDRARTFSGLPLLIDPKPSMTIAQLGARVRRCSQQLKRKGLHLGLVIVDYMQLVKPGERYRGDRVREVTEISAGLKRIAREENVALLALSQLSREVERREDKRPQLSDLRESGSIEQDADTVIFLFREEYYLRNREPKANTEEFYKWQSDMEACHGRLDVNAAKQRHGPTGTVTVRFDAATNVVRELPDNTRLPDRSLLAETP